MALSAYLVYLLCAGLAAFDHGGGGGAPSQSSSAGDASAANQVVLLTAFGASLILWWFRGLTLGTLIRGTAPYWVVIAIICASVLWSDVPDVATRRVVRFLLEFSFLAIMASCYTEPRDLLRALWYVIAIVVALDILALAVPQISFTSIGYQGVHGHKNEAGAFALVAFPIALAAVLSRDLIESRAMAFLLLAALILIAVLAGSKTSIGLMLVFIPVAGLAFALCRWNGTAILMLAILGGLALAALWLVAISGFRWGDFVSSIGVDSTLTGRDQIWRFTVDNIREKPWTGFGFGSFWDAGDTDERFLEPFNITFPFAQAHNGYLDVLIQIGNMGLIGVALMGAGVFFQIVRQARADRDVLMTWLALAIYMPFFLHNVTESTLLRSGASTWVFFVLIMLAVAKAIPKGSPRSSDSLRRGEPWTAWQVPSQRGNPASRKLVDEL